jgi:predicted ATPase
MRGTLPTGAVTFLFTDIEGSTKLLVELGADRYAKALAEHRRILREAVSAHGGVEVGTEGDAFFVAFRTASGALDAAAKAQEALASGPIRVRMGVHTGTPHLDEEGYVGEDVHKAARIMAAGHGGQVLLSRETRELVDVDVTDLGEHRLKDFTDPVWIFQLGSERFPPLKTISNTNLPRPASSFVGRAREVEEVLRLLRDGTRLLTLTGPGGSGKTRLAIEVAAELLPEFKAGVFWVGLGPLRDPALVPDAIAHTLGAKDGLAGHIGERELLLLLDNFEQVMEAALELPALISACPSLHVLVTSRELLRIHGEVEYSVPPLAEPEAVQLFSARSHLEPDETVAELCRSLDNLPLAVELAAARTSVLTPRQIMERVSQRLDLLKGGRDAVARQQTLRATIEWSHDLLDEGEKRLFARLAVFAGGSTLEAAQEVAEADLDVLQSLVEKSLLRHAEARFWMLETIREYAAERLAAAGEVDALRRMHAAFYLNFVEGAEPHLFGSDQQNWLALLRAEHDNMRSALQWALSSGETELSLRLAGGLGHFWHVHGYFREGRGFLEDSLLLGEGSPRARAKALWAVGWIASFMGDFDAASSYGTQSLELARGAGLAATRGRALWLLGGNSVFADPSSARPLLDEAVAVARQAGDFWCVVEALHMRGYAELVQGNAERARDYFSDCLTQAREVGDKQHSAMALFDLGLAAYRLRAYDEATSLLVQARDLGDEIGDAFWAASALVFRGAIAMELGQLETARESLEAGHERALENGSPFTLSFSFGFLGRLALLEGNHHKAKTLLEEAETFARATWAVSWWLASLGQVALAQSDLHTAKSRFQEALAIAQQSGARGDIGPCVIGLAKIAVADGEFTRAFSLCEEALRLQVSIGDRHGIASSLEAVAAFHSSRGSYELAVRSLALADSLRAILRFPRAGSGQATWEAMLKDARAGLSDVTFDAAWSAGERLAATDSMEFDFSYLMPEVTQRDAT